ncbi:MAG: acyl-CoA synthetase [Sphingomonadales bacterium]|jgi:fatty-acyl-CoA synthase
MSGHWNFADIVEAVASNMDGHAPVLLHGEQCISWNDFDARTNALARAMQNFGVKPDGKVAFLMRNHPAYIEGVIAAQKARLVHVNVNYRYKGDELLYIFENSDSEIVLFSEEFIDMVEALKSRLPDVKAWINIDQDYEHLISTHSGIPLDIERSGDDQFFVYTGGTTGMPKAVIWRQDDLWQALGGGSIRRGNPRPKSMEEHIENIRKHGRYGRLMAAAPFMHGAGLMTALNALANGGAVITLPSLHFNTDELLHEIERHQATTLLLVGDAFARPLLKSLDAGKGSIASLGLIISSGAMFSKEMKQGLLKHNPHMTVFDTYGSSEGLSIGTSVTSAKSSSRTAAFQMGRQTKLLREDLSEIPLDSNERGLIARGGAIPLGYYKDPEKTARTFPVIDGIRYSVPGDWGQRGADGTLILLGRGNQCINTGGEKVFPEEVEETLKRHKYVDDALVFGMEDEKWGQKICAVVSSHTPGSVNEAQLIAHVKSELADYKAPKRIYFVDQVPRQPSGKADYASARAMAASV